MIGFGDGDLGVFAADMGVDVTFAGVTVRGLLDETDLPAVTSDGAVEGIVRGTVITIDAPSLARLTGLTIDSFLTIDGRSFTVREFLRIDDGKLRHVMVAETTEAPVVPIAVARIVATPRTFSLTPGETQALTIVCYDADDNVLTGRLLEFESADVSIATVDADGLVTGIGSGDISIIIRCEDALTGVVATALAAWTPASVFGLAAWLKADAGITLNGATVSAWADQSGNGTGASQATALKQPSLSAAALNGLPVVRFDGATTFLAWALSLPAPYTVGVVFRLRVVPVNLGEGGSVFRFKDAGSRFHEFAALHYDGYAPMEVAADVSQAGGAVASIGFSPTLDTLAHRLVYSYAGGGRSDLSKYSVALDGDVQTLAASGLFGATASDVASIGARCDSTNVGSLFGNYDVAEIVIYNSVLAAGDRQHLETYLTTRWGL